MTKETEIIQELCNNIVKLETKIKLVADKIYATYQEDFINHSIQWDLTNSSQSLKDFKVALREEKK